MRVTFSINAYDTHQWGRPWIARITEWAVSAVRPALAFGGNLNTYTAEIEAEAGDVLRCGQKCYANPRQSISYYAVVRDDGTLEYITEDHARALYNARGPVPLLPTDPESSRPAYQGRRNHRRAARYSDTSPVPASAPAIPVIPAGTTGADAFRAAFAAVLAGRPAPAAPVPAPAAAPAPMPAAAPSRPMPPAAAPVRVAPAPAPAPAPAGAAIALPAMTDDVRLAEAVRMLAIMLDDRARTLDWYGPRGAECRHEFALGAAFGAYLARDYALQSHLTAMAASLPGAAI